MRKTGWRNIVVGGVDWRWRVGKTNVLAENVETGDKKFADFSEVTGIPWSTIRDDGTGDYGIRKDFSITPKHVADWLRRI